MTSRLYTREEMVEAYMEGAQYFGDRMLANDRDIAREDARRYVDAIQSAPSVPENAVQNEDVPENVERDALNWQGLYPTLSERLLKIEAQNKSLARIAVRMHMEAMLRFQPSDTLTPAELSGPEDAVGLAKLRAALRNRDAFADMVDWMNADEILPYFPELTEGA